MGERRDHPALRTQQWVILIVEAAITAAFGVYAVRNLLDRDLGKAVICLVGVVYVGFRAGQAARALFSRKP